jgi:hypothetical protein
VKNTELDSGRGEVFEPSLRVCGDAPQANGRTASSHHDLAFGATGLQVGQRLLGLDEREDAVDENFKLLGLDQSAPCVQVRRSLGGQELACCEASSVLPP